MHEFWAAQVFSFPKKRASQGLTVVSGFLLMIPQFVAKHNYLFRLTLRIWNQIKRNCLTFKEFLALAKSIVFKLLFHLKQVWRIFATNWASLRNSVFWNRLYILSCFIILICEDRLKLRAKKHWEYNYILTRARHLPLLFCTMLSLISMSSRPLIQIL